MWFNIPDYDRSGELLLMPFDEAQGQYKFVVKKESFPGELISFSVPTYLAG